MVVSYVYVAFLQSVLASTVFTELCEALLVVTDGKGF